MASNPQSRSWQLTINNPIEKSISHETIRSALNDLKSVTYFCMADEVGLEEKTPHTHIYIVANSGIRFSTLKKRFPTAHIEQAKGSPSENRAYIRKEGDKYANKAETSIPDTFEEHGDIPPDPQQGFRSDIEQLYDLIIVGKSNAEIMKENHALAAHINVMDKIRQDILEDKCKNTFRKLTVTYIFGPTETGKTKSIMEKHGFSNVYRVTDYGHPFDRYCAQPTISFEEFRSSIPIPEMLNYLDGYPITLPARYAQRVACYTNVYITSNIDLKDQYLYVQHHESATWMAFLRRIGTVIEYSYDSPPISHGSAFNYLSIHPVPNWVREANKKSPEDLHL